MKRQEPGRVDHRPRPLWQLWLGVVASGVAALYCFSGILMIASFKAAAGGGAAYDRRAVPWEAGWILSLLVMLGLLSKIVLRWIREARMAA
jgi:hypothetical protein